MLIAKPFTNLTCIVLTLFCLGCKHRNIVKHDGEKDLISFEPVFGISYTEIARRSQNGLSFNHFGYQLEPEWKMRFVSNDSTSIYSPTKKQFINFPLTRGYDSIFNTARTWLKVKTMTKDSMIIELLKAYADSVDTRGAKVYMVFYADKYINNALHGDLSKCKSPSKKDSVYIQSLTNAANKDFTKAFSARQPVELESKSPHVTFSKRHTEPTMLNNFDTSYDYMNPEFDITIDKAYSNFYYSFSMFIDPAGQIHYGKPLTVFTEKSYEENYIHLSTAVMNSYLKYYLNFIPGKTLGIVHTSEIAVHVTGNRGV
ncbi:hypothetical protein J3L18_10145 [Mucilaginibacter gossypii]|uniref:hypothetical protein n=1 Tax=Mucilaginibacter gossypii TaxID=551996 RepID=UPI000DCDB800|nr:MULTISPECIES: hypothetical protein [Mucilaginibacter]QTE39389.1 hypothetical protein J3L18_10145 [Mucilaginibacter gossypii]RAV56246.1 hypothetical protein DIU36_15980 [Mucilaginibacter rubeus]